MSSDWASASNQEVLLAISQLQSWGSYLDDAFPSLFRRILLLNLDTSLPTSSRIPLLRAVTLAFQSIESPPIRKECAPLVSISIWENIQNDATREKHLDKNAALRKTWRASQKRFEAADTQAQAKMRIERGWLYSMVIDFMGRVQSSEGDNITYCERFLEFLIELSSGLPTRRYTHILLEDLNIVPILRHLLPEGQRSELLRELVDLLLHFLAFSDSETASPRELYISAVSDLQRTALKHFQDLKVLALSNLGSLTQAELKASFSALPESDLERLGTLLNLRTSYPKAANITTTRELLLEIILAKYQLSAEDFIGRLSILPTEYSLYSQPVMSAEAYDSSKPLAMPKLNVQYLNLNDFMWRSFVLHRAEALFEIKQDMEGVIRRMKPRPGRTPNTTEFEGFSKMAMPIARPAIIEVAQPLVGTSTPAFVRAEIILDVSRLNENIRRDWDKLRPNDVVFLLALKAQSASSRSLINGHDGATSQNDNEILYLRAAEVVQMLDENSRPLREVNGAQTNGFLSRPRKRRLLVNIDAITYKKDLGRIAKGKSDIYSSINVIARRQARENNFKPILETIQKLVRSQTELPTWLQDVYLGYGDPKAANYKYLSNRMKSFDFKDTFLNWEHLVECFPGHKIDTTGQSQELSPPYVLEIPQQGNYSQPMNPKKRNREQMEADQQEPDPIVASSYQPPNTGPYPSDLPKLNSIRFTPTQVEAIVSGTQPGLTLVVGPPGTGKTDVATQIINLLYHNFPKERILLVAHSNQALNQLFQKIIALDIDSRHLLRLGHGEEGLDTEASYSKFGRVESFLENRQAYLSEVNRLAASIGAEGAHGNSCETAEYFDQVHVQPAWSRFWDIAQSEDSTRDAIIAAFPFQKYFANAPVSSLLPDECSADELREIASGCQHHISKIFAELESIRPFEILRHGRDQQNHLLVKEARIIAMTSTHAAMRRAEIAESGFHYDTLVMEEAAQITEIESFIPCAMQNPDSKTGELPLKRIVLIGDHLQNSPIIQNIALRQYSNLEQSLFLRLVRLGVPTINLDQQGRCRPSIAKLFEWRYAKLGNLSHLMQSAEFVKANPGFRYDYQFIDVPDYQGQGEREPTPHFIQNLGEAEYAVALYQYMRLLGYPARSISILATYAGQQALIKDVLEHRCKGNRLFGLPRMVTTVDKYQGEQNDYVILSMTRTKNIGYLRDVRRLTVALSRARLGLYVLGRRELFETCTELGPAMAFFSQRPDKLALITDEMFPTERAIEQEVESTEMEGIEHLGQYVYEMTRAKIEAEGGKVELTDRTTMEENEGTEERIEEVEEDPLHEF